MEQTKEKDLKEITKETEKYNCIIQKSIFFINEFLDGPMCGRCMPCPMGSYEMRLRFKNLEAGKGTPKDIAVIKTIAPLMYESSMCKKGKDAAKFIMDTLENSPHTYTAHVDGICPEKECKPLIVYKVIAENCVMCNDCKEVCKDYAILGEKKVPYLSGFVPYEIVEPRCTRCNECIKVCNYNAIEIVNLKDKEPLAVCTTSHG
ncbi:NADH dehydrogenase (quinone) [Candidatus Magnetoovum chiemensis]|nr:NADH dehydrogenase (quinone) [Candidatus Magnetoovum chiemensis]